jgi:HEAT repeat protein/CRP-like cAMP-binding protein
MRLYPAANPQVQRSNDFVLKAFKALLESEADDSVTIAFSDGRILVCGEHLSDKDLSRPQIQGLITLFGRLKIHSFTFHPHFSFADCSAFIHTLSELLAEKEMTEPISTLLDKAGIASVTADLKRYVAIREGEQVVRDELIGSGLNISDEELANFVLGKSEVNPAQSISPELVQELISRLPAAGVAHQHPEEVTKGVIDFLHTLSKETDFKKHADEIEQSARALSGLDPALLAKLVATLPPTPDADAMLGSTLHQLSPQQLNTLISNLVAQQTMAGGSGEVGGPAITGNPLNRLTSLEKGKEPAMKRAIAQNIDARQLLLNPDTTLAQLPEHLLQRLKQPEWSAPVLATAAQQVADPQIQAAGQVDFAAFNRMLGHYEQLLSKEQQTQVARQAGAQLASMEGVALGNIIAQKFKGLFGEQLYSQVINQVSDELLDETVEHLTPKQLNRMIATLTSDIPLQIGKDRDPDFKPADDSVLKRLAQTKKGPEVTRAIAQNIDARMLQTPSATMPTLPDRLATRLQQPAWSTPVLVAAAQQSTDLANFVDGRVDHSTFEHVLDRYDTLLDKEKQAQVATQVAAQLATFDEKELGLLLVRKYKNLFGEQLYRQVISQLSEEKLGKLINHFRAIVEGRDILPLSDIKDTDIEEAYKRLQQTVRGEKMRAIVEMHQQQKKQREEQRQVTLQSSLDKLLRGDLKDLEMSEIHQALPETVRNLLFENKEETADNLLMQLAAGLQHSNPSIRGTAFHTLAAIGEQLAHIGQWERLEKLLPALKQGLQLQGINELAVQQTMTAIGGLAGHHLTVEKYTLAGESMQALRAFSTQDTDSGRTNPLVRQHALETLKSLCTEPVLEQLIQLYLHSETHQEAAGRLLIEMGVESAKFQLQQLINNESRFERKRLLSLIKQTGNPALSILLEQLHKDAPWFVVRNIIRLLGEIGNPALFITIKTYINHPDLRVQQEVINSSVKIGGEHLKDFLLHALQTVDDSLKIRVVNHIAAHHDERFVRPLTDLLESAKPFPGKNKNDLQLAICKTLGIIGSRRSTASLTRVAQSKNVLGLVGYSDEVRQTAGVALEQIRAMSASQKGPDEDEGQEPGASADPPAPRAAPVSGDAVKTREDAIFRLAAQGDRELAKQQLVDLIAATAHSGDFKTAERLRERIYEIDTFALGEIIRSNEIIEQEKMGAIKEEDLEIWANLTDRLSSQEFQAIYHELSERRYAPEETIVAQGDKNDALFFISQGSIKVSHLADSRELFITSLNRGQIAGENFFTPSFWTVSLTSLTPSRIQILPQAALSAWQEQFPGLRAKLHAYYLSSNPISSMLEKKGLERRQGQRFSLSRKIQVQPITNLDNPIGRGFRAETADVSLGGLAFLVRISRQENARLLLGRRMQVVLPVGGKAQHLHLKGLVIGIQPFHILENDFSVHFKFDQPLDQQGLQTILG